MNPKEKRTYKRITRLFDSVQPSKTWNIKAGKFEERDKTKRIDMWTKILCLEPGGKLYTIRGKDKKIYFLDKDTCYCLYPELEKLLNELQKND